MVASTMTHLVALAVLIGEQAITHGQAIHVYMPFLSCYDDDTAGNATRPVQSSLAPLGL